MSIDACAEIVAKSDPDRFAAALMAPLQPRADLLVLYAFNSEVARAPWVTEEPMLAEMRLQWWRDAVEEIYTGTPVRKHEVTTPLAEMLCRRDLPRKMIDALIDARRWEFARDGLGDIETIKTLLENSSATLMELATIIAADAILIPPQGRAAAREIGLAEGAAAILQAYPSLRARGDIPAVAHATPKLMRSLGEMGRLSLIHARKHQTTLARPTYPAIFAAVRAEPILIRADTQPEKAFEAPLEMSDARIRFRRLMQSVLKRW